MYYYHYTTKQGYDGIKNNHEARGNGEGFPTGDQDVYWTPYAEQPQKDSRRAQQHEAGFYFTRAKPNELTNKTAAKLGVNMTVDASLYVFVFQEIRGSIGGYVVQTQYQSTNKLYIRSKSSDTNGKMSIRDGAVWCGKAIYCPQQYGGFTNKTRKAAGF